MGNIVGGPPFKPAIRYRTITGHHCIGAGKRGKGYRKNRFLKIYLGKHPHLEKFVWSPECALIKVKVESICGEQFPRNKRSGAQTIERLDVVA